MYLSKSLCNLISNFLKIPLVASAQLFQDTNLSGGLFRRFDEGKCTFVLYHSIFDLIDPIYNFFQPPKHYPQLMNFLSSNPSSLHYRYLDICLIL